MKKILINSTLVLSLATLSIAEATDWYVGMGSALSQVNTYSIEKERVVDATLKAGFTFSDYLDFEFRGDFYTRGEGELSHPYSYGAFMKPKYDITKRLNIYTLLGMSKNKLKIEEKQLKNDTTIQSSFSYGAGIEYTLGSNFYLYGDILRYIDKSTTKNEVHYAIKIDSVSVGLIYKFEGKSKKYDRSKSIVPIPKTKTTYYQDKTIIQQVKSFANALRKDRSLTIQIRIYKGDKYENTKKCATALKYLFIDEGIEDNRIDFLSVTDKKLKDYIKVFKKKLPSPKRYDSLIIFED